MIYYSDKDILIRDLRESDAQVILDGSGVWYQDRVLGQYEPCRNDDDLVLYFSKKLR